MKRYSIAIVLLSCVGLAAVLGCANRKVGIVDVTGIPVTITGGPTDRFEIPFETVRGMTLITAEIEGVGERRFIFDTGAFTNVITEALISELGLTPKATTKVRGRDERIKEAAYLLPPVRIGDHVFENVSGFRHERYDIESMGGADSNFGGILSWSMFKDYMMTLDYEKAKLVLEPRPRADRYREHLIGYEYQNLKHGISMNNTVVTNESYALEEEGGGEAVYLSFIWRGNAMCLPVKLEDSDQNFLFVVDSGANQVCVRADAVESLVPPDAKTDTMKTGTIFGVKSVETSLVPARLRIGIPPQIETREMLWVEKDLETLSIDTWPSRIDGILGFPFLSRYRVTIDHRNRMVVLRAIEDGRGGEGEEQKSTDVLERSEK